MSGSTNLVRCGGAGRRAADDVLLVAEPAAHDGAAHGRRGVAVDPRALEVVDLRDIHARVPEAVLEDHEVELGTVHDDRAGVDDTAEQRVRALGHVLGVVADDLLQLLGLAGSHLLDDVALVGAEEHDRTARA